MLTSALRFVCYCFGVLLTVLASLAALVAACIAVSLTVLRWQGGYFTSGDAALWRWSAVAMGVLAPLAWTAFRVTNGVHRRGQKRARPSSLVRRKGGRQERRAAFRGAVVWLGVVGGFLWKQIPGEPWERAGMIAVIFAGGFGFIHGRLLLHELGHLAAGALLGLEPIGLRIGQGPLLWRRLTRGGFEWEWRLWPSAGCAEALDRNARVSAWRQFGFAAGGPLADVLFAAWVCFALHQFVHAHPLTAWLRAEKPFSFLGFVLWILFAPMLIGLVPSWRVFNGRLLYSDGWWLAKVFFLPARVLQDGQYEAARIHVARLWTAGRREQAREELLQALARYPDRAAALALLESWLHGRAGEPEQAADCVRRALDDSGQLAPDLCARAWAEHAALLAAGGDPGQARACCAALLERFTGTAERVPLLDAFACLPIMHQGTAALLPDAQRWCAEALALAPGLVTLRGTRGAILVEQKRDEEAVPILQEVIASTRSNDDRGIAAFYLALAAARRGRRREMLKYRGQALRFCKVPLLLSRTRAELPAT